MLPPMPMPKPPAEVLPPRLPSPRAPEFDPTYPRPSSAPLLLPLPSMGLRISWSSDMEAGSSGWPVDADVESSYMDSSTCARVAAAEDDDRFLGAGRLSSGGGPEDEALAGGGPAEVEGREEEGGVVWGCWVLLRSSKAPF